MQTNTEYNVSFKKLIYSYYMNNTPKQNQLCDYIESELKKTYPKKKKNYLQVFEKNGYNVYINQGNEPENIDVYISRKKVKTGSPYFNNLTYVGTYNKTDDFDVTHVDEIYKQNLKYNRHKIYDKYMKYIIAILGTLALCGYLLLGKINKIISSVENENQSKNIIKKFTLSNDIKFEGPQNILNIRSY